MYSDASGAVGKGFGVYCGPEWICLAWDIEGLEDYRPSIEYLEWYFVAVGVLSWIKNFKNTSVLLHCDNDNVCKMINKSSSGCKNCMVLIRRIVLECLLHNVDLTAEWLATGDNGNADALSRMDFEIFRDLGPSINEEPSNVPAEMWPVTKLWLAN